MNIIKKMWSRIISLFGKKKEKKNTEHLESKQKNAIILSAYATARALETSGKEEDAHKRACDTVASFVVSGIDAGSVIMACGPKGKLDNNAKERYLEYFSKKIDKAVKSISAEDIDEF